MNFGIEFGCFSEALGAAFLVVWALNKLENEAIFCVVTDYEFGTKTPINTPFGLLKDIKA